MSPSYCPKSECQSAQREGTAVSARWLRTRLALVAGLISAITLAGPAHAQSRVEVHACGGLANAFGPFDYRPDHFKLPPGDQYPYAYKLNLVEIAHFTPKVEALLSGQSTHTPGPDIDYTLRAFPNHHRALASLIRLSERSKEPAPAGLPRSIECYFDRAARFVPEDVIVRLLYANFLFKAGQAPAARRQVDQAVRLAGDSPFTNYNIGLVCLEAKEYDLALRQAHRALALGFTRLELKEKLVAAGRWAEPAVAPAAPAPPEPTLTPTPTPTTEGAQPAATAAAASAPQ